jgi:hypothetical protein
MSSVTGNAMVHWVVSLGMYPSVIVLRIVLITLRLLCSVIKLLWYKIIFYLSNVHVSSFYLFCLL